MTCGCPIVEIRLPLFESGSDSWLTEPLKNRLGLFRSTGEIGVMMSSIVISIALGVEDVARDGRRSAVWVSILRLVVLDLLDLSENVEFAESVLDASE